VATCDLEEQEQIDLIKTWWKRNGTMVVLAVVVFAVTVVAVQGWRQYQYGQTTKASMMFEALQGVAKSADAKKTRDSAGQIMEQYPSTAYAARAALIAAKSNYEAGDAKSAKAQLQWAVEHAKEDAVRDMARLRLSIVLLDEKNYAEALKLVELQPNPAFSALYADLKGDILAVQGKNAEAGTAYQSALEKIGAKSPYRELIQLKLDGL